MTRNHLPNVGANFWIGVINAIGITVIASIVIAVIVAQL